MRRIVVIDDNPMVLQITKATLEKAGFDVTVFEDPGAFDPSLAKTPDLILIDINMPQFFGDDIVTYFKEERTISAPIYLFSDVPVKELKERAAACGADGYIYKGWGLEHLLSAVVLILGQAPTA